MRQLTECLVCAGKEFTEYKASTFFGEANEAAQYFLANRKGVVNGRIVMCLACGFKFTNPQVEADAYDEIYKATPGLGRSDISTERADMRRFQRLARYVRDDVPPRGRFLEFGCGRGGFSPP
jgi:hypothetical protein